MALSRRDQVRRALEQTQAARQLLADSRWVIGAEHYTPEDLEGSAGMAETRPNPHAVAPQHGYCAIGVLTEVNASKLAQSTVALVMEERMVKKGVLSDDEVDGRIYNIPTYNDEYAGEGGRGKANVLSAFDKAIEKLQTQYDALEAEGR